MIQQDETVEREKTSPLNRAPSSFALFFFVLTVSICGSDVEAKAKVEMNDDRLRSRRVAVATGVISITIGVCHHLSLGDDGCDCVG